MTADVFEFTDEWGPEKVVCVSDTRTGMKGVLVLDNTARGMGKGGTRMSPTVTVEEVARLAHVMTLEGRVDLRFPVAVYHGGGARGIPLRSLRRGFGEQR